MHIHAMIQSLGAALSRPLAELLRRKSPTASQVNATRNTRKDGVEKGHRCTHAQTMRYTAAGCASIAYSSLAPSLDTVSGNRGKPQTSDGHLRRLLSRRPRKV